MKTTRSRQKISRNEKIKQEDEDAWGHEEKVKTGRAKGGSEALVNWTFANGRVTISKYVLSQIKNKDIQVCLERFDEEFKIPEESKNKRGKASRGRPESKVVNFYQSSVTGIKRKKSTSSSAEDLVKRSKCSTTATLNEGSKKISCTPTLVKQEPQSLVVSAGKASIKSEKAPLPRSDVHAALVVNEDSLSSLHLKNSANQRLKNLLQMVYVKLTNEGNGMAAFVGWKTQPSSSQLAFQCIFCPFVEMSAKTVSRHVLDDHSNVMVAVTKKAPPLNSLLYMHCSHCDFVAIDTVIMWVHFSICHKLPGILSLPGLTRSSPTSGSMKMLKLTDIAVVFPMYTCLECDFMSSDYSSTAQHTIRCQPDKTKNALAVKIQKITRPKELPKKTYADMAEDSEFADHRSEMNVCVMCDYVCFTEILVIQHHLRMHADKALVLSCAENLCSFHALTSVSMIKHLKEVHNLPNLNSARLSCSATLVKGGENGLLCDCL